MTETRNEICFFSQKTNTYTTHELRHIIQRNSQSSFCFFVICDYSAV